MCDLDGCDSGGMDIGFDDGFSEGIGFDEGDNTSLDSSSFEEISDVPYELEEASEEFDFSQLDDPLGAEEEIETTPVEMEEDIPVLDTFETEAEGIEIIEPETLEPEIIEPETQETEVIEPMLQEPEVLEPETPEPEVLEPEPQESEVLEPEVLEPETEVQENEIDYEQIYNEIEQEQLSQGFKDIDIEADPERLNSTLENFQQNAWDEMTLDEQKNSMSELYDYVTEAIGFENPPTIEYYNNGRYGDYGAYDPNTNTLRVNEYMLGESEEAADTIAHELWHAHQHECADNPQNALDYQYRYNFDNYIPSDIDQDAYESQLVEAEARAFASQFKGIIQSLDNK